MNHTKETEMAFFPIALDGCVMPINLFGTFGKYFNIFQICSFNGESGREIEL